MAEAAENLRSSRAVARYVRIAPRKTRAVVDMVRGRPVEEAVTLLTFSPKSGAKAVLKVVNSAIANAEKQLQMGRDDLLITEAFVDQGPTLKRFKARAMGRASRIRKRTSHITVVLSEGGR